MATAKESARQIIEHLPEQATWDEILIEAGLQAAKEGRTVAHKEAKRRLLLNA